MAKKHIVHCRVCKQEIDINSEENWIRTNANMYYHSKCYNDWKNPAINKEDEEYKDLIYDFLTRDLKVSYNYFLCEQQRKNFLKEKMTNKGIYFALKYFYEIKHNAWDKGHGGIGIVPMVYKDSYTYWQNREAQNRGFMEALEKQIKERSQREVIKVKPSQTKKNKIKYSLDDIGEEDG